ncbi:hypothetical protein [Pseudoalteromonas prydzensis]|uniref:hypothetical protein n=1 Tax=Pseudoalteromonas prydzensis TaxID=182141 RepID=UPI003FD46808
MAAEVSKINMKLHKALIDAGADSQLALEASQVEEDFVAEVTEIKTRLQLMERLQWAITAGVIGIFIKSFFI